MKTTAHMAMASIMALIGAGGSVITGLPAMPARGQDDLPVRRTRTVRNKYRFIHVQGNAELEAQLAEKRAREAAASPYAAQAIQQAQERRDRRAAKRAREETDPC